MLARTSPCSGREATRPDSPLVLGSLLILAPIGRDAAEIVRVLANIGVETMMPGGLAELCDKLWPDGGASAAALVIAEEALSRETDMLVECLARQPAWSDLPIVVLTAGGQRRGSPKRSALLAWLGNVTLLERPLQAETLRSAIRAALRARARQHDTRRHLEALRLAAETLEARVNERTRALAAEAAERARAEAAHRALYLRTPIPLQSLDAEGRLLSVSDRWLEFMGYGSHSEVVGRPVAEFMTAETARLHREAYWPRLLAKDAFDDLEYCLVKHSGEVANVLVSARVERDAEGRFVRTMTALVDVTARRRAESQLALETAEREAAQERLRQAQKMEALGQLAGGVAHDFNNSAAVMLAGLALLEKRHGAALAAVGPAVTHLLAGLKEGAERGASVARRLLSFARREALRATDIELAELLGTLREVLANALGHSVRVLVEAPAGLPALRADRPQLETTLINLSINARDAMPSGGTVTLSASCEDLSLEQAHHLGLVPGAYLRLSVTDTGVGMDAATLARATEPFFTTKPKDRGTGLGLSMADGFAAQSGGALRVESTLGRGTAVTLWLPQADEAAWKHTEAPSSGNDALPFRALIVDDVPVMRRFLRECLDHAGWTAAEASNTAEALAQLQADGTFDLIITDLVMPPGPDGTVLIHEAQSRYPKLRAILISGAEALPDVAPGAATQSVLVLRKPVSPSELTNALAALFGRPEAAH